MEFYKYDENFKGELMELIPGSDLDQVIKSTLEEVAPLRVGMCILTKEDALMTETKTEQDNDPRTNWVSPSDKLFLRYFRDHNAKDFIEYARLLSMRIGRTRFSPEGDIWFDKGKHHKFDVVPAVDVEQLVKDEATDLFYLFMLDIDGKRHICGLFLYDKKNYPSVLINDLANRPKKIRDLSRLFKGGKSDTVTADPSSMSDEEWTICRYLINEDRLMIVGPCGMFNLHEHNALV